MDKVSIISEHVNLHVPAYLFLELFHSWHVHLVSTAHNQRISVSLSSVMKEMRPIFDSLVVSGVISVIGAELMWTQLLKFTIRDLQSINQLMSMLRLSVVLFVRTQRAGGKAAKAA